MKCLPTDTALSIKDNMQSSQVTKNVSGTIVCEAIDHNKLNVLQSPLIDLLILKYSLIEVYNQLYEYFGTPYLGNSIHNKQGANRLSMAVSKTAPPRNHLKYT